MQNNFKKLSLISLEGKTDKKGKYAYLSWATAWSMIKMEYPDTQRTIYESEHTGLNFFTDGTTAYVKVGITVVGLEHIDYLPIMDFRNQSIPVEKITSMAVNTAIQRSTAKAIAMHGLGLTLWSGEDLTQTISPETSGPASKTPVPKKSTHVELAIDDGNWVKVLKYVADNKNLGLPKIVKNLEVKYKIKPLVKKELSKHIK